MIPYESFFTWSSLFISVAGIAALLWLFKIAGKVRSDGETTCETGKEREVPFPDSHLNHYEPEPPADPAAKMKMIASVRSLEAEWSKSSPLLDDGVLKVWHRPEGGSIHSFKYEVVMPMSPEPCIALAKEIDLLPTWHKFVPIGLLLGTRPIAEVFGGVFAYAELWMPWPLKNRAMLCQSAFYDCLDEPLGAYIAVVGSINEDQLKVESSALSSSGAGRENASRSASSVQAALAKAPTTHEQCPRLAFESFTVVTPLPPEELADGDFDKGMRARWTFYFHKTDYSMEVPGYVLGFLMKVCAPFVCTIATRLATNLPSAYRERMASEDAFYGVFRRRCGQHVRKQVARLRSAARAQGEGPPATAPADRLLTPHRRHQGRSRDGSVMRRPHAKAPLKKARSTGDFRRLALTNKEPSWNDLKVELQSLVRRGGWRCGDDSAAVSNVQSQGDAADDVAAASLCDAASTTVGELIRIDKQENLPKRISGIRRETSCLF
mmetsp:Transcript_41533/g.76876  ORF Transcript_41533/g.76876 Transcript_41533/m.76876 type:complete len:493 (+) Transcript_41533:109-1587(+)